MKHRFPRLGLLALALFAFALGACGHRLTLDAPRFAAKITINDANASRIRVYVSHRLKVTTKVPRRGDTRVDTDIHLSGRRQINHRIVGRRTRGKIVAIDERRGRSLIHVAFEDRCDRPECAFGFLGDDAGARFSLFSTPELPAPVQVRARDRGVSRELRRGYLRHFSEPEPVYRATRRRRGPLTVDLQVVEHAPARRLRLHFDDGASPEPAGAPSRPLTVREPEVSP